MNYDKYRAETIEADHTVLGSMGVSESTVAAAKKVVKSAAGLAVSAASTVLEAAKIAVPGGAHVASAAANAGLSARDQVSVQKTEGHIRGLKEIQSDLAEHRAPCSCEHCTEAVGYAISQKTKKLNRKEVQIKSRVVSSVSPVPLPISALTGAVGLAHTVEKEHSGTRGVERNRQAGLLHSGARGVRFVEANGAMKFVGGCAVARAIIDELTGHWQRMVMDDKGAEMIAQKLKSK